MLTVNPLCPEALLQFIWQTRRFNQSGLVTTTGEPLLIHHPGTFNRNAGPDFTAAHLRIGSMEWAGNVELHYRTSDWNRHGHQHDPRYGNIILHVVFEHDRPDTQTPVLELQHLIPKMLMRRYSNLMANKEFVPCAPILHRVPEGRWEKWLPQLMAERLERKTAIYRHWLEQSRFNWEEVCIRAVAQSFGMPVNTQPFLEMVQSIPFNILARLRLCKMQLEALLFGQAGMLMPALKDAYSRELQEEYRYLQHKFKLLPIQPHQWQWLRMRPASFPTMRIAHFAALLHNTPHFFSRLLDIKETRVLEQLLQAEPSDYWHYHYRFDIPSVRTAGMGKSALHHILINAIVPLLHLYGTHMRMPQYTERAMNILRGLPAEDNRIIRSWTYENVIPLSSLDSQSLLQLKQYYCDEKRCLECHIGASLIGEDINQCNEADEDRLWGMLEID